MTTTTVDELDSTFGPFDVRKVDVEGFERQVLLGASTRLKRQPRVILELHSPLLATFGSTVENVLSLLDPASFSMEAIPRDDIANLFLAPA